VSRILKKTFFLKYIIRLFDGFKLIKTKPLIKKYVKVHQKGLIIDSTQNHRNSKSRNFPNKVCLVPELKRILQKSIRTFGNRKYSNILRRVYLIYKYIWKFKKRIRILIRIFNMREYSNTTKPEYFLIKNLGKNPINLRENLIFWAKIRFFEK
jgi:hypothetical protein